MLCASVNSCILFFVFFFFFKDTATTEIYTLSLHDALPIWRVACSGVSPGSHLPPGNSMRPWIAAPDRKSTRLNSSHSSISYAVFCLKKKNTEGSGGLYGEGATPCSTSCSFFF